MWYWMIWLPFGFLFLWKLFYESTFLVISLTVFGNRKFREKPHKYWLIFDRFKVVLFCWNLVFIDAFGNRGESSYLVVIFNRIWSPDAWERFSDRFYLNLTIEVKIRCFSPARCNFFTQNSFSKPKILTPIETKLTDLEFNL